MDSYHVLELAGQGSFGRVYKGRKIFSGQIVALKFIPKVGRSEKELQSLKGEIEIMRGLEHPNIVQMFDSFETETEFVVVTEYAEGDLFQILEDDGNLPESQVCHIACQLVSALYYLHSHRILHRDLKPQNILLAKCGVVKLCDFGFARSMSISTLVLTSIKGTPLYMSPEQVKEKPYDHTADLWSLGCILYELHTGAPPFYTYSIFQLAQIIVRDPVKWPDTMSPVCTSFLKGLLTKDPQKRLSWPDLLHHPFVADGVLVLSDTGVFSPLTVTPSPEVMARKLQQVKEKTAVCGERRLLRKARKHCDGKKQSKGEGDARPVNNWGKGSAATKGTAKLICDTKEQSSVASKHSSQISRGQISRDYEQQFPSVEVGPQLVRRERRKNALAPKQDVDSEEYWEKLVFETDPRQNSKLLVHQDVISQVKVKLLAFKYQLEDGIVEVAWQTCLPLRVLCNLILAVDLERSLNLGCQVGLPHFLLDLVKETVESRIVTKQPWIVKLLEEVILVLLTYWYRHCDWAQAENRLDEFAKPFVKILKKTTHNPLAPLAALILSMFTQHGVSVDVGIGTLTAALKSCSLEPHKPRLPLPPGWGLCDGLLYLILHSVSERGPPSAAVDEGILLDLWKAIGASLETARRVDSLCSDNGLYSFLSAMLFAFIKYPPLCVPLFSENESKCVRTLGLLLRDDRLSDETFQEDLRPGDLAVLSCLLLCFPFSLDLPSKTTAKLLQLYDSCGVVTGLLQMIRTLPPQLLELPLTLLGRVLLCDPERSVPRLSAAAGDCGFFASRDPTTVTRNISSLLAASLQVEVLWDSAVELLALLSQVARCSSQASRPQLHLEAAVLHRALGHSHAQIRAATCSLLGNLNPFVSSTLPSLQPATFKDIIGSLHDSCVRVRRMACRAVGSWLGFIGEAGLQMGRDVAKARFGAEPGKPRKKNGRSHGGRASADEPTGPGDPEGESGWAEESRRTVSPLAALITDQDALTRRHSCAALGNLATVGGGAALLEEDVIRLLVTAACTDPHHAVRQAAIRTLCLYGRHCPSLQVLVSLDVYQKAVHASHLAPPQCDYQQLIDLLK